MKYFYSLLIITSLLSCSEKPKMPLTKQQQAEVNVKNWLFKNLNDTVGYQSVEFDSLKSHKTSIVDTFINENERKKAIESFKPQADGYELSHNFRAKNKIGATILNRYTFLLDTSLNVTNAKEK